MIVVDTNAWLLPFTQSIDIASECERLLAKPLCMPSSVELELQSLAAGSSSESRAATAALRWSRAMHREPTPLPGDDGVLDVARRIGAAVLTNDKRLQDEVRKAGLQVVRVKGRQLALD